MSHRLCTHPPAPPSSRPSPPSASALFRAMERVLSLRAAPCGRGSGAGRAGLQAMANVRIGFFSFTEVTDPAEHRSYNEWHQLDHMPEQFPIAGGGVRTTLGVHPRVPRGAGLRRPRSRSDPLHDPVPHGRARRRHVGGIPGPRGATPGCRALPRAPKVAPLGPPPRHGPPAAPRVLVSAEADSLPAQPRGLCRRARGRHRDGPNRSVEASDDEDGAGGCVARGGRRGRGVELRHRQPLRPSRWRPGDKTITVCYLDVAPLVGRTSTGRLVHAGVDCDSCVGAVRRSFGDDHTMELGLVRRRPLIRSPCGDRPRSELDDHLAGVAPCEQEVQGLGRMLEAVDKMLGVFDLSCASHPTMSICASRNRSR